MDTFTVTTVYKCHMDVYKHLSSGFKLGLPSTCPIIYLSVHLYPAVDHMEAPMLYAIVSCQNVDFKLDAV